MKITYDMFILDQREGVLNPQNTKSVLIVQTRLILAMANECHLHIQTN